MRKRMMVIAASALLLAALACGEPTPEPAATTAPTTDTADATAESTSPPSPTEPPAPSATPAPTNTPAPTATPSPAPTETSEGIEDVVRVEVGETQERGGVRITVQTLSLASYADAPDDFKAYTEDQDYWTDAQTVGGLDIEVENTTDQTVNVYPDQATIVADDEQVQTELLLSDNVGGEIMSGVMKEGAVLFGLKRHLPEEIQSVRYIVDGPSDEDFTRLGDDYDFTIQVLE